MNFFNLGAKGYFKVNDRVKVKGESGWYIVKFLGKKVELNNMK